MLLSNYAIKFRTAVFVAAAVLVAAGIVSYRSLPREGAPDITIPFVFVTAIHEGAAPSEMEKLVTIPLEKSLGDLENVKEMRSASSESVTTISIEFVGGQDIDMARQRVKDKVDLARHDLPEDLDEPIVDAFNFSSDFPVFIFAISGDTPLSRLKGIAENLQDEIEMLPGVRRADISGIREREVRVELDLVRLVAYRVPISVVMQRIAAENSTISAGNIEVQGNKFQVRVPGEFRFVSELGDILLVEHEGRPIYLRDVAEVVDTHKDLSSISRLNGRRCVSIGVKKRARENAVKLIEEVKELLDTRALPPDIESAVVMDQSEYVAMMIEDLENNVASGFILVIAVLFLFMGWRNSFFVAVAIPLSMLIAFTVLSLKGETLNMLVLFSLVLAVGMLVDNAIVIVENIYRNRSLGMSKREAARRGASEVAWPVITSTITTCAAFSPLLFWPDIMGQFMSYLPRTLIIVLVASLFVAIVVNPAICSALITRERKETKSNRAVAAILDRYDGFLRGALANRWPVLLIGVLVLVLTGVLYGRYGEGQELFPEGEPRNATITVRYPQGTGIDKTDAAMKEIERKLERYEDVKFFLTTVGTAAGAAEPWGGAGGTHLATMHVEFVPIKDRAGLSSELVDTIRREVGAIPGAEVKVEKQREGPPTGAPVSIEISGDDFQTLSRLASEMARAIQGVDGLVDIQDDFEEALPEMQFRVNRHRAAMLGLDTASVGFFLRTAVYGTEISKFRADEDEFDITLRLPAGQRNTLELLDNICIPTPRGGVVPLSSLGEPVYVGGKGAIARKDRKRVITITGNNENRGVDEILEDVKPIVEKIKMPRGYEVNYAGDTEEMEDAKQFLRKAFGIALGLIVVVLVIQFNSAILPGLILASVVLSLIGVMWGLLIFRMKFGVIMTGVGIISLAGIVVNNAIVLIDCILQRRAEGMESDEAIVAAGRMRLRPVVLTAVTTVLGLIPMAIGYSLDVHSWPPKMIAGAETSTWWAPMAVAVIFGLSVATILTLVLLPVMYSLSDSLASVLRGVLQFDADE